MATALRPGRSAYREIGAVFEGIGESYRTNDGIFFSGGWDTAYANFRRKIRYKTISRAGASS